jgi:protein phosphatase
MEEKVTPYIRSLALKDGDRLLLCTDGLTSMVSDTGIAAILQSNPDVNTASEALVKAANGAGGDDNITVVVIDWLGRSQ